MISGRNNSLCGFPFTASQWQELEQQLLTYKYIMSGVPVPSELISTVIKNSFTSSSSGIFHHQSLPLPFGWGCFQVGYGRKLDPEPGRCRRTDGKKWRCSKEAFQDSKYCEKHMHRGKSKSKKNLQVLTTTPTKTTTNNNNNTMFSSTSNPISCSVSPPHNDIRSTNYPHMAYKTQVPYYSYNTTSNLYPFLSPQSSISSSSNCTYQSTQSSTAPHWLYETQSYDQPKKEIRYLHEMKGAESYEINKQEKEQRFEVDKEDENQKLFHYFLGDWSRK